MLRIVTEEGCSTQKQVLNYLGERFRVKLSLPDWYPNEQAAEFLFKYVLLPKRLSVGREVVVRAMSHLGIRMDLGVAFWSKEAGPSSVPLAIHTFLSIVVSFYFIVLLKFYFETTPDFQNCCKNSTMDTSHSLVVTIFITFALLISLYVGQHSSSCNI